MELTPDQRIAHHRATERRRLRKELTDGLQQAHIAMRGLAADDPVLARYAEIDFAALRKEIGQHLAALDTVDEAASLMGVPFPVAAQNG